MRGCEREVLRLIAITVICEKLNSNAGDDSGGGKGGSGSENSLHDSILV